jgi:hypothetical protein
MCLKFTNRINKSKFVCCLFVSKACVNKSFYVTNGLNDGHNNVNNLA